MNKTGKAKAPGAGTIINAIAPKKGAAYAINLHTKATIKLDKTKKIKTKTQNYDPTLVKKCVKNTLKHYNQTKYGATIKTKTNLPTAKGLKSSSAASNAATLATISALNKKRKNQKILDITIQSAKEAGVTITGAIDDQTASLLGGVTFTDNQKNKLEKRIEKNHTILIYVPTQTAQTKNTHTERAQLLKPQLKDAYKQAKKGEIYKAMTLNGIIYSTTLDFSPKPILDALEEGAKAASLSGTGTAYTAIVNKSTLPDVRDRWKNYSGRVIQTKINNKGSQIL